MQSYVGHNDAAHRYWGQATHGRQLAGPAHLNIDKLKRCFGLFSGKFMRNRPTRGFCDKAKPFLPLKPVNLVDHAVNIIGQVRALTFDAGIMGQRIIAMRHADEQWRHGHAPRRDGGHDAALGLGWQATDLAPSVRKEPQRP